MMAVINLECEQLIKILIFVNIRHKVGRPRICFLTIPFDCEDIRYLMSDPSFYGSSTKDVRKWRLGQFVKQKLVTFVNKKNSGFLMIPRCG